MAVLFVLLLTIALPVFAQENPSVDNMITVAKDQLGVKYKYGGTTKKGFDCSGFTSFVFRQLGIDLPRSSKDQAKIGTAVKKGEWQVGDLLFFKINKKGISHVGIYIGNNKMIHAHTKKGIIIEDFVNSKYFAPKYVTSTRVAKFNTATIATVPDEKVAKLSTEAVPSPSVVNPTTEEVQVQTTQP